jgi:hypothetical protein
VRDAAEDQRRVRAVQHRGRTLKKLDGLVKKS